MRIVIVALTSLALVTSSAIAQEKPKEPIKEVKAPPALAEIDAIRLEKLTLERMVIEERFEKLKAQAEAINASLPRLQADWKAKNDALEGALAEAAKRSNVDLKEGWQPNVPTRTWVKP